MNCCDDADVVLSARTFEISLLSRECANRIGELSFYYWRCFCCLNKFKTVTRLLHAVCSHLIGHCYLQWVKVLKPSMVLISPYHIYSTTKFMLLYYLFLDGSRCHYLPMYFVEFRFSEMSNEQRIIKFHARFHVCFVIKLSANQLSLNIKKLFWRLLINFCYK